MQGKLLIFAAPSGAGKTTLVRHILAQYAQEFAFSISACTRPPRPNETAGKDYYFMTTDEFKRRIAAAEFVEYEQVYEGQYYGTLKSEVQRIWQQHQYVLFDIDVKGAMSIKKQYGDRATTVFVKPPSIEILLQRLQKRNTETPESLRKRVDKAKIEMMFEPNFDIVIVNDDLQTALHEVDAVVAQFMRSPIG